MGALPSARKARPLFLKILEQRKLPLKLKVSRRCTHLGFLQGKTLKTDPFCIPPSPSADRQTEGVPEQWYPTVLDLTPAPGARYTH